MFGQIFAHLVGDYCLQSDWMALKKTTSWAAIFSHVIVYTIPFCFVTQSPWALAVICASHLAIDRYRLARYVCWAKNFMAPKYIKIQALKNFSTPGYDNVFDGIASGSDGTRRTKIRNHPWSACNKTGYGPEKPDFMAIWLMIITDQIMHIGCNYLAITFLTSR